jgi:hypothetical protein
MLYQCISQASYFPICYTQCLVFSIFSYFHFYGNLHLTAFNGLLFIPDTDNIKLDNTEGIKNLWKMYEMDKIFKIDTIIPKRYYRIILLIEIAVWFLFTLVNPWFLQRAKHVVDFIIDDLRYDQFAVKKC